MSVVKLPRRRGKRDAFTSRKPRLGEGNHDQASQAEAPGKDESAQEKRPWSQVRKASSSRKEGWKTQGEALHFKRPKTRDQGEQLTTRWGTREKTDGAQRQTKRGAKWAGERKKSRAEEGYYWKEKTGGKTLKEFKGLHPGPSAAPKLTDGALGGNGLSALTQGKIRQGGNNARSINRKTSTRADRHFLHRVVQSESRARRVKIGVRRPD